MMKLSFLLFSFITISLSACGGADWQDCGKLNFYNSLDKKSFSFTISDEFAKENSSSKPDKNNPKMSKAESKLLTKFLKNNNYCINEEGKLSFAIANKQERIYDITFSNLIEKNYNARPIVPAIYFGECV